MTVRGRLRQPVAGENAGAGLVAAGDDLEQVLSGGRGQGASTQVFEDEQVDGPFASRAC
jgi:hypothetical protein